MCFVCVCAYPPLIPSQDSRASVPNAPRALITHARSCTQSSRHAQPGAPGGRGRMARGPLPRRNRPRPEQVFSTRGPADSCVLPAVPVPCRYILRNVSLLLLHQDEGKEAPRGWTARTPRGDSRLPRDTAKIFLAARRASRGHTTRSRRRDPPFLAATAAARLLCLTV